MHDDELQAVTDLTWRVDATLGEGLVHDAVRGRVWFLDLKGLRLYWLDRPSGERRVFDLPQFVSAVAIPAPQWEPPAGAQHALLSVGAAGFAWLLVTGDVIELRPVRTVDEPAGNRFNDARMGPDGRFYAGTMDDAEQAATGSFYVLDAHASLTRIDSGYRVTNGPAFSPDGTIIYENDSALRVTYAYDLRDGGSVASRRVFHRFAESDGYPDGMTVDASGHLWVAMWDGAKIQRLDPEGRKAGHVVTMARRPTSCAIVAAGEILYTSARIGLRDPGDADGQLFTARVDARLCTAGAT